MPVYKLKSPTGKPVLAFDKDALKKYYAIKGDQYAYLVGTSPRRDRRKGWDFQASYGTSKDAAKLARTIRKKGELDAKAFRIDKKYLHESDEDWEFSFVKGGQKMAEPITISADSRKKFIRRRLNR